MATDKGKLTQLIDFIKDLSNKPGNEWFKERLFEEVFEKKSMNEFQGELVSSLCSNVENIQKYLAIDVVPVIDYSKIEDDVVRNQLYRDCIEMLKYRLGKINNHINFDEFCRYAHLQAEELINYFYYQKFSGNIPKIQEVIKKFNPKYSPSKPPDNLGHIDYSIKLTAFQKMERLDSKIKYRFDFINQLRNEVSHRNSLQISNEDNILCGFEKEGFSATSYVNLSQLTQEQKDIYFKGKFIINKRLQDYSAIYEALNLLKDNIIASLKP